MRTFVIITTPRARGDLLVRMLAGTSGVACANADGLLAKAKAFDDAMGAISVGAAVGAGIAAAARADGATRVCGIADRYAGHEGWREAVGLWSWLLESVPDLHVIFLFRDQAETELSMEATHRRWVPSYGTCSGKAGTRMIGQVRAMEDFHVINPTRTTLLDSADLLTFATAQERLASMGLDLDEGAWVGALAEVTHERRAIAAERPPHEEIDWDLIEPAVVISPRQADVKPLPPLMVAERLEAFSGTVEVHTLRYGDAGWIQECGPTLEGWCRRHGYGLTVHGQPEGLPDEKFATVEMIRGFLAGGAERMIFVDADVYVHPSAPGWPEEMKGFSSMPETFGRVLGNWEQWQVKQGLRCRGWRYRNSGVWSCDREAARLFLEALEGDAWRVAYREQHQFNVWWHRAAEKGMVVSDLQPVWNMLSKVARTDLKPAWFYHLNGPEKLATLKLVRDARFLPGAPVAIQVPERTGIPRAICIPWLASAAKWDELRYCLRSIERHWTDRECPIFILGPERPSWLKEDSGRVRFQFISYHRGKARGMAEATRQGMLMADEVAWWNDDIYLLRDCGWEDLRVAVTEGMLDHKVPSLLASGNGWQAGMANAVIDLKHHGAGEVMRYATHTPYLFEREKSLEIFRTFRLPYKGAWETLYHGFHGTPHRPIGRTKVGHLGNVPEEALFLNHSDRTLTEELKLGLGQRFSVPAVWEDPCA